MLSRTAALAAAVWRRVVALLRPAPIATLEELRRFLEERALLVAQKCAIDYVRGKTGLASYALFTEKPFLDALDVCRWEGFAAVLSDLMILTEGALRPAAAAQQTRLRDALIALHAQILNRAPIPTHRQDGWGAALVEFRERFTTACLRAPQAALGVADHSARRVFETLPIHSSMRRLDEEVIYGAVRFRMVAVNQELRQRLAATELVGQLVR